MYGTKLRARVTGRGTARADYPYFVQEYLNRVIAADVAAGNTQGLERPVTDAISVCLQALVADGILGTSNGVLSASVSLTKASCLMMGAQTLSGALVPLAGDMPAPTNVNFVGQDYDRRLGLLGDAGTKHLNANLAPSDFPQNNNHLAVRGSSFPSAFSYYCGAENHHIGWSTSAIFSRNNSTATGSGTPVSGGNFIGISRASATVFTTRSAGASTTATANSLVPSTRQMLVFAANLAAGVSVQTGARLSFYSLGQFLDLVILEARITALANAIQAAIP